MSAELCFGVFGFFSDTKITICPRACPQAETLLQVKGEMFQNENQCSPYPGCKIPVSKDESPGH